MSAFLQESVVLWSIGLVIGVPLTVILLSEMAERLHRADSPYEQPLIVMRNFLVPAVAFVLTALCVLESTREHLMTRMGLTMLVIILGGVALSFLAAVRVRERDKDRWESQVPQIAKTVTRVLAFILPLALIVTSVWDLDLSRFVTAIGVGSLAIGLALQNTLSSVVSGFLLALDRPFREGDWIEVDGVVGQVLDLNWRTTRIMVDGRDIVLIPNTVLLDSSLKNYTAIDKGYRGSVSFGFAYKDAPNLVKETVLQVARENPDVSEVPPPEVHVVEYGDSSVNYELHYHAELYRSPFRVRQVNDALLTAIFYAAGRVGLEIPFPIRTVRTTHEGELTAEETRADILSQFSAHPILSPTEPAVLDQMAEGAQRITYGGGTTLSDIGDPGTDLLLMISGLIEVQGQDGTELARLGEGAFLRTELLRGHRQSLYRLIVREDTDVIKIDRAQLFDGMDADKRLARRLGEYADRQAAQFQA